MKQLFNISVWTTRKCNLVCPSCPVGDDSYVPAASIDMTPLMLDTILEKINANVTVGTPMLHPMIDGLINVCHRYKNVSMISSNLSVPSYCVERALSAEPSSIRISCSGFTQATYQRGHKGGNIDKVKANMELISKKKKPKTRVHMFWHQYQHNKHEENTMRYFCEKLGIRFYAHQAILEPAERVVEAFNGVDDQSYADIKDSLITSIPEAAKLAYVNRHHRCDMLDNQIVVDGEGSSENE